MMIMVCQTLSSRIISSRSDSSDYDESSNKNRTLAVMDKLIYKSTHQHWKGRMKSSKSMRIDQKYISPLCRLIRSIPAATAATTMASTGERWGVGSTQQQWGAAGGARI
jgi:hypothetical protein